MPLYEYYCKSCHGIFETIRQMREAALPVPCPECNRDAPRIMSTFNAFVFREGYPRRLPDKGTYWHLGKEVKKRAKRMKGFEHPELAKPKPKPVKTRGDMDAERDKKRLERAEALYRNRWGIDKDGFRTVKAARSKKPERKVVGSGKLSSKR
jgi:putative FmdB family regulatory protein